ncbi:MAG: hypothetical protein IKQ01_05050 [Bacteroidales bacterium]|nr:hypothetical protein [Bacteroidales bacterium]
MIILGDETVRCLANCLPGPALSVHQRALAAWRSLPQEVQLQWNALVWNVEPHRPPFDHSTRISGYNLFVSAYHGFATLGNEQVPEPRAFEKFPPFAVGVGGASAVEGLLVLPVSVFIAAAFVPERYRLLAKIQLTQPGKGRNPGKMRNVLADRPCVFVSQSLHRSEHLGPQPAALPGACPVHPARYGHRLPKPVSSAVVFDWFVVENP